MQVKEVNSCKKGVCPISGNRQSARELDDQRQRLEAKHAAEMEQLERRLRAAHQTEVSGLRSELIAAKEQTRTVQVEAAAAQAARAVEQKMARQEAAGLGEAAALKRQVALYEQAMRQVGPVLATALETLAMLGRAAPLPEEELAAALELNASLTNAQRVLVFRKDERAVVRPLLRVADVRDDSVPVSLA